MTAIGRLFAIFFGLLAAGLAAGVVLVAGIFLPESRDLLADMQAQGLFAPMIGIAGFIVWSVTLLPAVLIIILLEVFSVRSVIVYGLLGAGLAAVLLFQAGWVGFGEGMASPFNRSSEVVVAAGIAAGLVYWVCAGRRAGRWRRI